MLFAKAVGQLPGDAFGHSSRIDEHQRGAVLRDEFREAIVQFWRQTSADITASSGESGTSRARSRPLTWPPSTISAIRDGDRRQRRQVKCAIVSIGFCVAERPIRCSGRAQRALARAPTKAPDARRACSAPKRGSRRRSLRSASSSAFCGPIPSRAGCRAILGWLRRYAAAGGASGRARRMGCRRSAPRRGYRRQAIPTAAIPPGCCGQRLLKIALDVVRQGFQRRDIDNLGFIRERRLDALPHQRVDRREERRQRLARSGRRGDQRVAPRADGWPGAGLRHRGRAKAPAKPAATAGWKRSAGFRGEMTDKTLLLEPRRAPIIRASSRIISSFTVIASGAKQSSDRDGCRIARGPNAPLIGRCHGLSGSPRSARDDDVKP